MLQDSVSDAQPFIHSKKTIQEAYSTKKNKLFDQFNVPHDNLTYPVVANGAAAR